MVGPLQTCAGHGAGAESAVHAMREIFEDEHTDAVLLIDASNAFNCMNRYTALHNVQIICPIAAVYLTNCMNRYTALHNVQIICPIATVYLTNT